MALIDYNVPRTDWIPGAAWDSEDDREEFTSKVGLACVLQRDRLGHWCGYVALPEGHPWAAKDLSEIDSKVVYGGIKSRGTVDGAEGFFVGFACNEPGDLQPGMMKWRRDAADSGTYRTFDFAMAECEKLAEVVAAAVRGTSAVKKKK